MVYCTQRFYLIVPQQYHFENISRPRNLQLNVADSILMIHLPQQVLKDIRKHTYWQLSGSVRPMTEMVFVNGLLQDSGSDNDYLMYPTSSGGNTGYTELQFTYKVPINSKVKITYIPE